ncbi:uncharacterized protein LOC141684522 [Apium graveolens]|uniref:uncharacterized protein LOC141684522 n=1 Tax=Apium graveolens TaxID=4045 RepID=UPI003D7B12F7
MEQVNQFNPSSTLNDNKQVSTSRNNDGYKQLGFEEKKAAVNEEMRRLNQLPSTSTYVVHRSRVLGKIMQLLSVQRTTSQDEELELLFAGLSL